MPSAPGPSLIDFINLIALFLAVWHTVRRLDAAKQEAAQFPHVELSQFTRWRSAALRAHGIVLWVCFGYIACDLAYKGLALPALSQANEVASRAVGIGLFAVWAVGVGFGFYRVRGAERLRRELGIEPGSAPGS